MYSTHTYTHVNAAVPCAHRRGRVAAAREEVAGREGERERARPAEQEPASERANEREKLRRVRGRERKKKNRGHGSESERVCVREYKSIYGVATISRLLKITGLFCKRAL